MELTSEELRAAAISLAGKAPDGKEKLVFAPGEEWPKEYLADDPYSWRGFEGHWLVLYAKEAANDGGEPFTYWTSTFLKDGDVVLRALVLHTLANKTENTTKTLRKLFEEYGSHKWKCPVMKQLRADVIVTEQCDCGFQEIKLGGDHG